MEISNNHKWLLDFCGYYNGEEENPFNERLQQNEAIPEYRANLNTSSTFLECSGITKNAG